MFFLTPLHGSGHACREEEEMARGIFASSHKRIVPAARDMIKYVVSPSFSRNS
jgi:hypothetical protein